ncbi:MAG: arsenite methyltransferase [Dehalococcoidia bacterium]|nr:MAG: arsenite methyltransferase [Dehalococcoidia bacterium]
MGTRDASDIKKFVRERYAEIARQQTPSCCAPRSEEATTCCSPGAQETSYARRLYSREELESISVNIPSLGCGNPAAVAELKAGEVVLDLGSGGGIDCFLAAQKVGPEGRVIGLDMTAEMIRLARENAEKLSLDNVEFRLGEMEHMPIEASSVDVVISNCVINLSPDKDAVFQEAFRVLKPGGRMCVSDIVTQGELTAEVRESLEQWAACVAGALGERVYLEKIRAAGFVEVSLEGKNPPFCAEATTSGIEAAKGEGIANITVTAYKPK